MKTGGKIASILGAMLLGSMGKGEDKDEATKKLPSDDMTKVHFMKKQDVETPEAIDAQAMVRKQGLKPTFDNINRASSGQMNEPVPLDFQPLSNEALMGDPMKQRMMNYNYKGTGPAITDANRPDANRDVGAEGQRNLKQMYADEMIYGPEKQPDLKDMYAKQAAQQKQPQQPEEPGIMQKLIQSIMAGKKPNPEEPYTNRGKF
jgi:hypothetical protein